MPAAAPIPYAQRRRPIAFELGAAAARLLKNSPPHQQPTSSDSQDTDAAQSGLPAKRSKFGNYGPMQSSDPAVKQNAVDPAIWDLHLPLGARKQGAEQAAGVRKSLLKNSPPHQQPSSNASHDADAAQSRPPAKRSKVSSSKAMQSSSPAIRPAAEDSGIRDLLLSIAARKQGPEQTAAAEKSHAAVAAQAGALGLLKQAAREGGKLHGVQQALAAAAFGRAWELKAGMEVQLVELSCAGVSCRIRTLLLECLLGKGGYALVWQAKLIAYRSQQGTRGSPFQLSRVSTTSSSSNAWSSRSYSWPESLQVGTSFALKVGFGLQDLAEEDQQAFDDEQHFMSQQYMGLEKEHRIATKAAPHPGVVRAYGWGELLFPGAASSRDGEDTAAAAAGSQEAQHLCKLLPALLLELVRGGSLLSYLRENGGLLANQALARQLLKQVIDALCHLESVNVVHRDLKSANILLDRADISNSTRGGEGAGGSGGGGGDGSGSSSASGRGMQIRLADFGISLEQKSGSLGKTRIGTMDFMPAEMLYTLDMFHDHRVNTYQVSKGRTAPRCGWVMNAVKQSQLKWVETVRLY